MGSAVIPISSLDMARTGSDLTPKNRITGSKVPGVNSAPVCWRAAALDQMAGRGDTSPYASNCNSTSSACSSVNVRGILRALASSMMNSLVTMGPPPPPRAPRWNATPFWVRNRGWVPNSFPISLVTGCNSNSRSTSLCACRTTCATTPLLFGGVGGPGIGAAPASGLIFRMSAFVSGFDAGCRFFILMT